MTNEYGQDAAIISDPGRQPTVVQRRTNGGLFIQVGTTQVLFNAAELSRLTDFIADTQD